MRHYAVLIFAVIAFSVGCGKGKRADGVVDEKVPSKPEGSSGQKQKNDQHAARLRDIQSSAKGTLAPFAKHESWNGHRLKVTGMSDGLPTSESIGEWHIELVPDATKNVVEIRGLVFAKNKTVLLDLDNDQLSIDGTSMTSKAIEGKSPLYKNVGFRGVSFTSSQGNVRGKASILVLEDGRIALDFDKINLDDVRAHEYGAVSPK